MNIYDQQLQEFFFDIRDIDANRESYPRLEEIYQNAISILDKNLYSDLNIQDERGNTHLHYVFKEMKWTWAFKLLSLGADPTIENENKRNAFQMAKSIDGIVFFWQHREMRQYSEFKVDKWKKETQSFHINFKKALFEYFYDKNKFSMRSVDEAIAFLKENDLDSDKNKFILIAQSAYIKLADKISWYEKNYSITNNISQNSEFLSYLLDSATINTANADKYLIKFLKLDFEQNYSFDCVAKNLLNDFNDNRISQEVIGQLFETMQRLNFSFNKEPQRKTKSIMDYIMENPASHALFLNTTMSSNAAKKKALKI